MKSKFVLAIVLCFTCSTYSFAWKVMYKPKKKIVLYDISFQEGMFKEYYKTGLNLEDMRAINPDADLLKKDFSGYDSYDGANNERVKTYTIQAGFQLNGKDNLFHRLNPMLCVGLTYFAQINYTNYYMKSNTITGIDTIVLPNNFGKAYLDSSYGEGTSTDYYFNQTRIDASLIVSYYKSAPWSIYAGVGFSVGSSLYCHSQVRYGTHNTTYLRLPTGESTNAISSHDSGSSQVYINKRNLGVSVFIPAGFDFRIGNRNRFFEHFHLFAEIKPGLNFLIIRGVKTISNFYLQKGIGFKYSF